MDRIESDRARVIIPVGMRSPDEKEINAAWLLARYFNVEVKFIPVHMGYKMKTPDFMMMGKAWELKSPHVSKDSMWRLLKRSTKQADNIVVDCRKLRVSEKILMDSMQKWFIRQRSVRHLLILMRDNGVVEFKK